MNRFLKSLKKFRFNSVLIKNFLMTITLMLIVIALLSIIIYNNALNAMHKELDYFNQMNTQRIKALGDTIFREIELIIADAETNSNVRLYISSDNPEKLLTELHNIMREKFSVYPLMYKYIQSIYIYSERGEKVFTSKDQPIKDFDDTEWLEMYKSSKDDNVIWARRMDNSYPYIITFMKKCTFYKENGAIIVNVNIKELGEMLGVMDDRQQEIFITDDDGKILYSKDRSMWLENVNTYPALVRLMQSREAKTPFVELGKDTYAVTHIKSEHYNWTYSTVTKVSSYNESVYSIRMLISCIILGLLLVSLCIAVFMALNTYKPVQNIMEVLENPKKWKFNSTKSRTDEVKYITEEILTTIYENDELQKELENRLVLLNNAHIRALQAQLNPHFLGNTLNLINLLIINDLGHEHTSSKMLNIVSKLLRYTLEMNEVLVTVDKEIEYAKMYVDILKERYEDMFYAEWNISPEIRNKKILKLCLQPLIENALYHGISPRGEGGIIKITGKAFEDGLVFSISDNGVGIKKEAAAALHEDMNSGVFLSDEHVGIKNVHQRIRLMFGEKYGVQIDSDENFGTDITIKFPIVG